MPRAKSRYCALIFIGTGIALGAALLSGARDMLSRADTALRRSMPISGDRRVLFNEVRALLDGRAVKIGDSVYVLLKGPDFTELFESKSDLAIEVGDVKYPETTAQKLNGTLPSGSATVVMRGPVRLSKPLGARFGRFEWRAWQDNEERLFSVSFEKKASGWSFDFKGAQPEVIDAAKVKYITTDQKLMDKYDAKIKQHALLASSWQDIKLPDLKNADGSAQPWRIAYEGGGFWIIFASINLDVGTRYGSGDPWGSSFQVNDLKALSEYFDVFEEWSSRGLPQNGPGPLMSPEPKRVRDLEGRPKYVPGGLKIQITISNPSTDHGRLRFYFAQFPHLGPSPVLEIRPDFGSYIVDSNQAKLIKAALVEAVAKLEGLLKQP